MKKQVIHKGKDFINVNIQVMFGKQDDYFVLYCPALELSSYGKTEEEAKKNFEIEMSIFIDETEKRGTLEKILLKLGWSLTQVPSPTYVPPKQPKVNLLINQPQTFTETVAMPL